MSAPQVVISGCRLCDITTATRDKDNVLMCAAIGCPYARYAATGEAFVFRKPNDGFKETPRHYGGDTAYEVIKVLEAWLTPEMFKGFLVGNVLKYQARAHLKGSESEDRKKADWYSKYLVEWEGRRMLADSQKMASHPPSEERRVPRYDSPIDWKNT